MTGSPHGPTEQPATWPADPLRAAARLWPDSSALILQDGSGVSWAALDRAVDRSARALRQAGAKHRDLVAFACADPVHTLLVIHGALRLGALAVPLSHRLPHEGLKTALQGLGDARLVDLSAGPFANEIAGCLGGTDPAPTLEPPSGPGRRATVVHTSGSTGKPRAVVHSLRAHQASAAAATMHLGFGPEDRWLVTLPFHHVAGLSLAARSMVSGGALVLPRDAGNIGQALRAGRITHVSLVATQLGRLLRAGARPPSTLRCVLLGGGPLPETLAREACAGGWPLVNSYGMTETASLVTATEPGETGPVLVTAGRVLGGRQVRIDDRGGIQVRGTSLCEGFLEGGRVVRVRDENGWFTTGDLGRIDSARRLSLAGRADRMFVSGGENVQPEIIEDALLSIKGVAAAAVVPVEDAEYGARPVAFVDSKREARALESELRAVLPGFLVPRAFLPWPTTGDESRKWSFAWLRERAREALAGKLTS